MFFFKKQNFVNKITKSFGTFFFLHGILKTIQQIYVEATLIIWKPQFFW